MAGATAANTKNAWRSTKPYVLAAGCAALARQAGRHPQRPLRISGCQTTLFAQPSMSLAPLSQQACSTGCDFASKADARVTNKERVKVMEAELGKDANTVISRKLMPGMLPSAPVGSQLTYSPALFITKSTLISRNRQGSQRFDPRLVPSHADRLRPALQPVLREKVGAPSCLLGAGKYGNGKECFKKE